MKLSDFIRDNIESILEEWEQFAGTIQLDQPLDKAGLRDHARSMLQWIAADLDRAQTPHEQAEKSKGRGPTSTVGPAGEHGSVRLEAGFSLNELISEYRALRASVVRLWSRAKTAGRPTELSDLTRFNEAVDQALAESIVRYSAEKETQTRLFNALLTASSDHGYILDLGGRLIYANKSLTDWLNKPLSKLVGKTFVDLGVFAVPDVQQQLQHVIDTGKQCRGEMFYSSFSKDGATFEYVFSPVLNSQGKVEAIVGTATDITERKESEEKIWKSANYDVLTGLPNRRLFRDRLQQDVKQSERADAPIALLFIDLDAFKEVNDLLGHDAGDLLLRRAADRISSCVRGADTVARLGGDEFTVVLTDIQNVDHVEIRAREILDELSKPFHIRQQDIYISASIGITLFPKDATAPEDLIRNADQAMYMAKKAGRNRFSFFTESMRESAWSRLRVIDELRVALVQRQFIVYYQPIIDLSDGRIAKAEALLRWLHPQMGLVLPDRFIGLAEEARLIGNIDDWVLDEAAKSSLAWSTLMGKPFQVSVNRSPVDFMTHNTREMDWEAHLTALGLARNGLSVEITEGVLLNATASVRRRLDGLQKAGVQLAIDDFGTGYSSMAYLRKFDIDYLKIDQSFVHDVAVNTESQAIVETIIVMAHKLGLKVIAEGVETIDQKNWLKAADCDYAQGYLFSRAVPSEDFEKLLS